MCFYTSSISVWCLRSHRLCDCRCVSVNSCQDCPLVFKMGRRRSISPVKRRVEQSLSGRKPGVWMPWKTCDSLPDAEINSGSLTSALISSVCSTACIGSTRVEVLHQVFVLLCVSQSPNMIYFQSGIDPRIKVVSDDAWMQGCHFSNGLSLIHFSTYNPREKKTFLTIFLRI